MNELLCGAYAFGVVAAGIVLTGLGIAVIIGHQSLLASPLKQTGDRLCPGPWLPVDTGNG